jgi:putative RNA 2'-phosphotransferase
VDLQFSPVAPPATLYHGASWTAVAALLREGLRKTRRHHVHLSADLPTAITVGRRHGEPVVLAVEAVAPRYLRLLESADAKR